MVGVFTHLDQFQSQKLLSATKKRLKDWFWTEIHDGVKMFHFSGVVNGQYYLKNKVRWCDATRIQISRWTATRI